MVENLVVLKSILRHSDGTFLILRRSKTDQKRPGDWDFPGGLLDPGESLEEGALRELKEEIGIKPDKLILRYTMSMILDEGVMQKNYIQMIFAGTTEQKEITLSYEHDMYEWLGPEEFLKRFAHLERYHKAAKHIIENNLVIL